MRPFECPVTILNTLDHLAKFDGKFDDGFFVGYSINSKTFKVFNTRTRFVEENLHINFLENKPNVVGTGPNWMFDIDTLTMSMNYQPVFAENQTNGPKSSNDEVVDDAGKQNEAQDPAKEDQEKDVNDQEEALRKQFGQEIKRLPSQGEATNTDSTNRVNTVSSSVNAVNSSFTTMDLGRERAQRNEFKSVFRQDKDTNGNGTYRIFTPVNAARSSYENLGGSIPVNAATFPNDDFPTNLFFKDKSFRIQDWKNKSLSIAGRLQLIHSILGSMHIYWASVFILPTRVLLNIEQLMRQFLWCHGSSGKGKSKVAWEIVCLPKHEGGLGIRRLECFNSALMASHIWKLLTLKESLWVKWIHEYKLKGRNFWDFPMRGNMSWGWRKILKLRPIIRKFIWSKIGNGRNTSLWFDTWADFEPLAAQISPRDIARSGLSLQSKVQDVIHHGLWVWPQELLVKYPFLNNYNTPIRDDARDTLVWRNIHGNVKEFSVSQVWNDIRHRDSKVNWYSMV
ncbi:hypothetical protein Tco_1455649 [Tanacetum coccineum]